jgi:hypothetical protein
MTKANNLRTRRPMGMARPPTMPLAEREAIEAALGIGLEHTPEYALQLRIIAKLKLHGFTEGICTFDTTSNPHEIKVLNKRGQQIGMLLKSEVEAAIQKSLGHLVQAPHPGVEAA